MNEVVIHLNKLKKMIYQMFICNFNELLCLGLTTGTILDTLVLFFIIDFGCSSFLLFKYSLYVPLK